MGCDASFIVRRALDAFLKDDVAQRDGRQGGAAIPAEALVFWCRCNQNLSKVGKDAPVASLVGICQRAARHETADAHVVQLAANGARTRLDISQAFPKRQLCKRS